MYTVTSGWVMPDALYYKIIVETQLLQLLFPWNENLQ
jgi:hypothetical protein